MWWDNDPEVEDAWYDRLDELVTYGRYNQPTHPGSDASLDQLLAYGKACLLDEARWPVVIETRSQYVVWLSQDSREWTTGEEPAKSLERDGAWYEHLGNQPPFESGAHEFRSPDRHLDSEVWPVLDAHVYEHRKATGYYNRERKFKKTQ